MTIPLHKLNVKQLVETLDSFEVPHKEELPQTRSRSFRRPNLRVLQQTGRLMCA